MDQSLSEEAASALGLYHEAPKNRYWREMEGEYFEVSEANALRLLQKAGFSSQRPTGTISPAEQQLLAIQEQRRVVYVGSLPGYRVGFQRVNQMPALVTDGPRLIEPKQGDWSTIQDFVETLLADAEHDQFHRVMTWLKESAADLYAQRLSTHLALTLVGSVGCGKTQFKDQIIVPVLGGRQAQPFCFMQGKTDFNGDLFDAEVLVIDDESSSAEWRQREAMKSRLKILTATGNHRHHSKFSKAIVVKTYWRVVLACNDDGNNLLVLPTMEDSIRDKVLMVRCQKAAIFQHPLSPLQKDELSARIKGELPAFLHWLLHEYEPPADLPRGRFGVAGWQHPDPIGKMHDLSSEAQLDGIIAALLFPEDGMRLPWRGMESKLAALLYADAAASRQLNLIIGRGAFSLRGMLHGLQGHQPERYSQRRQGCGYVWTILPPKPEDDEEETTDKSDSR